MEEYIINPNKRETLINLFKIVDQDQKIKIDNQDIYINGYKFELSIGSKIRYLETTIELSKFEKFWNDIQEIFEEFMNNWDPLKIFNKFIQSELMEKFINTNYETKDDFKKNISKLITDEEVSIKIGKICVFHKLFNIYFLDTSNRYIKLMNRYGKIMVRVRLSNCFKPEYQLLFKSIEISKDEYQVYHLLNDCLIKSYFNESNYYPRPKEYELCLFDTFENINKSRLENLNHFFNEKYQLIFNESFKVLEQINKLEIINNLFVNNRLYEEYSYDCKDLLYSIIHDKSFTYDRKLIDNSLVIGTRKGFYFVIDCPRSIPKENGFRFCMDSSSESELFAYNFSIDIFIFSDRRIRYILRFKNFQVINPDFSISLPVTERKSIGKFETHNYRFIERIKFRF